MEQVAQGPPRPYSTPAAPTQCPAQEWQGPAHLTNWHSPSLTVTVTVLPASRELPEMVSRVPPEAGPRLGLTRSNIGVCGRSSPEGSEEAAQCRQGYSPPEGVNVGRGRRLTYHEAVELLRLCAEVSGTVTYTELHGSWWRAGHQRLLHLTHNPRGQRMSSPASEHQPGHLHTTLTSRR